MNAFECYVKYMALKSHFTTKYDYHKYNGQMKASPDKFESRPDKHSFVKLAKHKDPEGFLLANILRNPNLWIGDIMDGSGKDVYLAWKGRIQSLEYKFSEDLKSLINFCPSMAEIFEVKDGQLPFIMRRYKTNDICLESLIILIDIGALWEYYETQLAGELEFESLQKLMIKYKPFIAYDRKKMVEILKKQMENS